MLCRGGRWSTQECFHLLRALVQRSQAPQMCSWLLCCGWGGAGRGSLGADLGAARSICWIMPFDVLPVAVRTFVILLEKCPKCALLGSDCSFKPQPGQACPNTVKIIKALSEEHYDITPAARVVRLCR